MKIWRRAVPCYDCAWGPNETYEKCMMKQLPGEWEKFQREVLADLSSPQVYCHTSNGTLLCAGIIKWQEEHCGRASDIAVVLGFINSEGNGGNHEKDD